MSEIDNLKYKGSTVPRVIRFVWTVFFIFLFVYLGRYALPDLLMWMKRM